MVYLEIITLSVISILNCSFRAKDASFKDKALIFENLKLRIDLNLFANIFQRAYTDNETYDVAYSLTNYYFL